jgi:hypothetical protein
MTGLGSLIVPTTFPGVSPRRGACVRRTGAKFSRVRYASKACVDVARDARLAVAPPAAAMAAPRRIGLAGTPTRTLAIGLRWTWTTVFAEAAAAGRSPFLAGLRIRRARAIATPTPRAATKPPAENVPIPAEDSAKAFRACAALSSIGAISSVRFAEGVAVHDGAADGEGSEEEDGYAELEAEAV